MLRLAILTLSVSTVLSRAAVADEIRHTAFPDLILGTWAETTEQCVTKDKSNIVIEAAKYGDADGSCAD